MLSIVIINFKKPALLRLCLKSLEKTINPSLKHETIVIDVASTLETQDVVLEEFPNVKLVPFDKNIGYTRGVNEGIRASSGDYFLFLNPDIIPIQDSVESMLKHIKNNRDIGLLGPRLLNFDGSPQNSCFRFYTPWTVICRRTILGKTSFGKKILSRFLMTNQDLGKSTEVDWLMGSALMASKEAIKKVGLMDEDLFLYMSDVDWPKRFWENGYKVIYFPAAEMYHYHPRDSKGHLWFLDIIFKKEARWHLKDAITYFRKNKKNLRHELS